MVASCVAQASATTTAAEAPAVLPVASEALHRPLGGYSDPGCLVDTPQWPPPPVTLGLSPSTAYCANVVCARPSPVPVEKRVSSKSVSSSEGTSTSSPSEDPGETVAEVYFL